MRVPEDYSRNVQKLDSYVYIGIVVAMETVCNYK
jgi:hypothetical protein